ncbi:sugar ABC transporter ATP-binding protein [Vibrio crassostreae]|uniref:sugar ABC transporter ATP-binding protein n=1 Tax=Vibrio crassostreae TaxID=246167 RepID=UPI0010463AB7|nr:sugar ABC transporter ATP-binding protein [Vibrio crassostreae]NOH75596.1 sugar ABC transporter ATP-binding protein [Vibrio crassostreae]TCN74277.1 monosaccharide ABC transporter ATP-binding protein (CUT2 family) [Vibrio crassostreae]TCN99140.1 monosaccharide ABC transporter ATP-binding protein (CUT2 family) [Vibrio crassostreae]TCW11016.1 monosaccharide ABC transporter ATP-binding protein (CUT2 family) [Vibrio crassostreae]TQK40338.1 monosaccharide ABC transporter ATP-binding protein (CUT2
MSGTPFITLKKVSKHFGSVKALDGINLTFNQGEVHCLAGKNGCGKSTLFKVISGVHAPEKGAEILLEGKKYPRLNPQQSIEHGIQVIYQDLSLFPNLTVAENIAIQDHVEWTKGLVQQKRIEEIAIKAMVKVGVKLPLDKRVEQLSIAECQLVAICRAMASDAKLMIMDEPTASLTRTEVNHLIEVVADLKSKGVTVVFVSHKLDEVMEISDRITVIRDGRTIGTYQADEVDSDELAFLMTGQRFEFSPLAPYQQQGDVKLEVKNLTKQGQYHDVSLAVRAGEIVSITGLLGAGRTELCMALFGMNKPDSGEILINGQLTSFNSNRDAIAQGIGYVSEDRMSTGLVMEQSIQDNITASVLKRLQKPSGVLDHLKANKLVAKLISSLSIKVADPKLPVTSLSGGNAQRISIAKWIAAEPEVLILDSPTVGVDVANKEAIYNIAKDLAASGMAIIMVSDEIPEVFYNSHRVIVMKEGRFTHDFQPTNCSEQQIMEAVNA